MKHIIIVTTAINRPMLHSDIMGEWIDWVSELQDKDTSLTWFINIDMVEKLTSTYAETKENFERLINNRIETVYLSNPSGKGNFLEACKRLSFHVLNHVDGLKLSEVQQRDIKVIWLEDDWKLSKVTKISSREVVQNYTTANSHTNLSFNRNNYIWALAPSIISYSLWKNLFCVAWMSETKAIDPEHCVGLYFRKMFGNPDHLCNVTIVNKSIKNDYLNERHMSFPESYYTYHDDKYQVKNNHRYIFKNCLLDYLGNKMVFIRITASFCVDGCNYGRNFLLQYNIQKSHAPDVKEFYENSAQEPKQEVKQEVKHEPKEEPKEELKQEPKEEPKDEPKNELKQETKEEPKEEPKEELKQEPKEEIKEETKEELKEELKEEAVEATEPKALKEAVESVESVEAVEALEAVESVDEPTQTLLAELEDEQSLAELEADLETQNSPALSLEELVKNIVQTEEVQVCNQKDDKKKKKLNISFDLSEKKSKKKVKISDEIEEQTFLF